jgi:hypothetical protein
MGIGYRTAMRNRRQATSKSTTTDATETPIKITRHYQDFPAPVSTSRRSNSGNIDARSLGASRPQGQRLGLSAAVKARLNANRRDRGAAAATAGTFLRNAGRGGVGARGPTGNRFNRGRRAEDLKHEDDEREEMKQALAKLQERMAPPPRQWLDHTPEDLSLEDLRVDWPNIPTGDVGMVEEVRSKLRWMSRKMQHGYDAPQELALRMHRGEMVHFESEAEREEVLKLARELAEKKAGMLTERRGEVVEPEDSTFQSLGDGDRRALSEELIKGIYPQVAPPGDNGKGKEKHSPAFLGEVVRMLGNNETYHAREQGQLVETIQRLLAPQQQKQKPQPQPQ